MQTLNEKDCFDYLDKRGTRYNNEGIFGCDGTFDHVLCFDAAPANTTAEIPCPEWPGVFDSASNSNFIYF